MTGDIISIYSSKGGVGKSFIAANLAVDIRLEYQKEVLLIDWALPFSLDAAGLLNIKEVKKIENILSSAKDLHPAIIKSFVSSHPSGISVVSLASGARPSVYEKLTPENIEAVLSKFQLSYNFIIIDIGMTYGPLAEKILDMSSLILIPVTPDFLSVHQAKNDLVLLRTRNFPKDKIKITVNMTGKNDYLNAHLLAQQLEKDLAAQIPFDKDAMTKMTEGPYPSAFPRHAVTKALSQLAHVVVEAGNQFNDAGDNGDESTNLQQDLPEWEELKFLILHKLLESIDFKKLDTQVENDPDKMEELENKVIHKITQVIDDETSIRSRPIREKLKKEVLQEALGLGPLEDILDDPTVTEIMVNRWDQIFVERQGLIETVDKKFLSEQHLMRIIGKIVAPVGRKVDTSTPTVDARLSDGSRVNAIIPPLAINGATLTIRKFPEERMGIKELAKLGSLNKQITVFLKAAVMARLNILISGGTGTGKTTLLNILSAFIPQNERIITVEDSAELQLRQPHVITLEARPPNIEGKGEITIRDLVKNTLRMRPDRIVVGECRGPEALDMLQAMNTGHDGSLTTVHANSSRESLSRLETLVLFTGYDLPSRAIKEQIVGAIDLIVQIGRFKDGSRKVIQVSEVTGLKDNEIELHDIFKFKQAGEKEGKVAGGFNSTGYVPECLERFKDKGIKVPKEIFWASK
jgi:septum site-determining protein MinD